VAVANGDRVSSPGCCKNLRISVDGEGFYIDCYGLALGSYEMVLGVSGLKLWDHCCGTSASVHSSAAEQDLGALVYGRFSFTATNTDDGHRRADGGPPTPLQRLVRLLDGAAIGAVLVSPDSVAAEHGARGGVAIPLCARVEGRA
jgi:hypothetical protein